MKTASQALVMFFALLACSEVSSAPGLADHLAKKDWYSCTRNTNRLEIIISGVIFSFLIICILRIKIAPAGCPVGSPEGTAVSHRSKERIA